MGDWRHNSAESPSNDQVTDSACESISSSTWSRSLSVGAGPAVAAISTARRGSSLTNDVVTPCTEPNCGARAGSPSGQCTEEREHDEQCTAGECEHGGEPVVEPALRLVETIGRGSA